MSRDEAHASPDLAASIVDDVQKLMEKISLLVGDQPPLTGKDRIRSTKFPKGGETIVAMLAALMDQFGVDMTPHPTSGTLAQLKLAQDLIPLHKQLVVALKKVDDAIFLGHSRSWAHTSVYYVTLRRLAGEDGNLAKALAPVTRFFVNRQRKGAVPAPEKT